jgi:hypothetical protein
MMPKFFVHRCPTINVLSAVNHFGRPEFSRLGGFSAESVLSYFVRLGHTGNSRIQGSRRQRQAFFARHSSLAMKPAGLGESENKRQWIDSQIAEKEWEEIRQATLNAVT